jgi:hypothetical protein
MTYAATLDASGSLSRETQLLVAHCATCATRLGFVFDTDHGPLWVGFLGSRRDNRQTRKDVFERAGHESDGRVTVAQWVDRARAWYMCDCKCRRNSADGPIINRAVLARRRNVRVPAQE